MKKSDNHGIVSPSLCCAVLVGLACVLPVQPVHADDDLRAGVVIQVPFGLGSSFPSFDPDKIRLGLTCQYADVEEDKYTHYYIDEEWEATHKDGGNQVYGLEGNIFVEVFNNFNGSAELLGFYGGNDIQGAVGAGYSFSDKFFLDVKAMFPYSEIGVRFMNQPEIYGGVKTLGSFDPKRKSHSVYTITPPD